MGVARNGIISHVSFNTKHGIVRFQLAVKFDKNIGPSIVSYSKWPSHAWDMTPRKALWRPSCFLDFTEIQYQTSWYPGLTACQVLWWYLENCTFKWMYKSIICIRRNFTTKGVMAAILLFRFCRNSILNMVLSNSKCLWSLVMISQKLFP